MIHPDPEMRPSAVDIIQHRVINPNGHKSKAQLRRELNAERLKNEILSKQLQGTTMCLKTLGANINLKASPFANTNASGYRLRPTPMRSAVPRVIGKNTNRSNSTTNF